MSTVSTTARTSPHVGAHLVRKELKGLEVLFVAFVVGTALIGAAIHLFFSPLESGVWSGATQFPHWFAVGMGVYLTAVYLPMYVAHGRTRRESAVGSLWFSVLLALWLGAAVTVGYAIEAGVYRLLGWSELLPDPHPVGSIALIGATISERSAVFLVFIAVGALGGAAFYRSTWLGFAVVLPCLALLAGAGIVGDANSASPFDFTLDVLDDPGLALRLAFHLALAAVAMAGTWPIVRDVPLRNRPT